MVKVNADHNNIFVVPVPSPYFDRLVVFLKCITEEAPKHVANLFQQLDLTDGHSLSPSRHSISKYFL